MGLDQLGVDCVMDLGRKQVGEVRKAHKKVKEPRVEAKKADARRPRNEMYRHLDRSGR